MFGEKSKKMRCDYKYEVCFTSRYVSNILYLISCKHIKADAFYIILSANNVNDTLQILTKYPS